MMKQLINTICAVALALSLCMCAPQVPKDYAGVNDEAEIYPDYTELTIPANIAPLNFKILTAADDYVTHIHPKGQNGIIARGATLDISPKKWKKLLSENADGSLIVDIYTRKDDKWEKHPPFHWNIAEEIDSYISYRQIEPSYIGFEVMRICQRNLENFEETEIFNNCNLNEDENGQCINCHSYQNYNKTGNMQMHVRINHGGTVIAHNGEVKKINLKTPYTISAGVYPSWHPTLPLIAYSVNITNQNFHSHNTNKVEVQDSESDIILYDIENNEVRIIANDSIQLETFPYWSSDGKSLYFASADFQAFDSDSALVKYKANEYDKIKYNLFKKSFDADTKTFGPTDTVYMASERGGSATFPRESPDGKYLLFTMAPYGTFHIWHKDADLYLMDLSTGKVRNMDEINSDDVESYHSWSSNGRWIIFSSRRDDGSFTRLYLTHFDDKGMASKPFLLPQRNPEHNQHLYKSYNIPEFMCTPASPSRQQLIDAVGGEAIDATINVTN